MEEDLLQKSLLIIGAGGIGSNLAELLIPALRRLNLSAVITMMDDDVVEAGNLGHQRYTEDELGMKKVDALAARYRPIRRLSRRFLSD